MTPDEVLALTTEIPQSSTTTCYRCGAPATKWWNLTIPTPYCPACLEKDQFNLLVALGLASNK